jgi:hypothetical protein
MTFKHGLPNHLLTWENTRSRTRHNLVGLGRVVLSRHGKVSKPKTFGTQRSKACIGGLLC